MDMRERSANSSSSFGCRAHGGPFAHAYAPMHFPNVGAGQAADAGAQLQAGIYGCLRGEQALVASFAPRQSLNPRPCSLNNPFSLMTQAPLQMTATRSASLLLHRSTLAVASAPALFPAPGCVYRTLLRGVACSAASCLLLPSSHLASPQRRPAPSSLHVLAAH